MMTREEAIKLLKQYQGYDPMFPDGETLKHAFDLTDETVDTLLAALRPVSREQVEKVWRGEWLHDPETSYEHCDKCSHTISLDDYMNRKPPLFCEMCGDAKTDEAVQMVLERMEALKDGEDCSI